MTHSEPKSHAQPDKTGEPAAEFDSYSRSYDAEVNRALSFSGLDVDFFTRVKADYLLDILAKEQGSTTGAALIDIGCGVGNYHQLIAGKVQRLVGVDVSSSCLATAKERNPHVEYAHFDGQNLPFPNASFDLAFAICVFHHVPVAARAALVLDIRRVLKPGGIFVIFEHNPLNPLTMRVVNRCEFDRDAVLLRSGECETLMKSAGFSKSETKFILTVPAAGKWMRRLDRLFAPLPFGAQYYTEGKA
jgi:ubiquinone/menaquinone biosynthesis C-methylase UbiE